MDILKTSIEWAKDEVFSTKFFILFGIMFIIATICFWQLGKTDTAKAFIYPTLVAGILLIIIGVGLLYSNQTRLKNFPTEYNTDPTAFVESEITRVEETMASYERSVFKVIPVIIIVAALVIIFMSSPLSKAISITTIAMMICIVAVDTNAHGRLGTYLQKLEAVQIQK